LRTAINLIRVFAVVSAPIVPATSRRLLGVFGQADATVWLSADITTELAALGPGHPFTAPGVLFDKVGDEQIAAWTERFGGSEEALPTA
jgi:methionyl-tRNA synthetase